MSEGARIQVGRSRPSCPFCKGEVAGGHVWVCPACEAPHHADCHAEHRACATCGPAPEALRVEVERGDRLARYRASAEKAGFVVLRRAEDLFFALHPAYPVFREPSLAHALQVVSVASLTLGQLEADMRQLAREPLARCLATVLYVVDELDAEVERFVRAGAGADLGDSHARVPLAWTSKGLVAPRALLGSRFPRHDDVALRVGGGAAPPATAPARPAPPPPPPPVFAPPRPAPPRPAPPPSMSIDEVKGILIALAAAVGLGVLLLALAMAAAG